MQTYKTEKVEAFMANVIQGQLVTNGEKFCIVISRFNEFIGSKLLSGAIDELVRHGVNENNIDIIWTPGAFEIPVVAKKAAEKQIMLYLYNNI